MSKMLFDSQPLVVDPDLAVKVGLNEAIVLQQLHYWTEINRKAGKNIRNGYTWTYNSYEGWQQQFPFWALKTVKRILTKLKNDNLITVANFNKTKMDRTNWYRINYEELETLKNGDFHDRVKMTQWKGSTWPNGKGQLGPTSTRDYTEIKKTTTEKEPKGKDVVVHSKEQEQSKAELEQVGVSPTTAAKLIAEMPPGRIDEVIQYAAGRKDLLNMAGFVVAALNYEWTVNNGQEQIKEWDRDKEQTREYMAQLEQARQEAEKQLDGKNPFTSLKNTLNRL